MRTTCRILIISCAIFFLLLPSSLLAKSITQTTTNKKFSVTMTTPEDGLSVGKNNISLKIFPMHLEREKVAEALRLIFLSKSKAKPFRQFSAATALGSRSPVIFPLTAVSGMKSEARCVPQSTAVRIIISRWNRSSSLK